MSEVLQSNNLETPAVDWSQIEWKPRFFIIWFGQSLSLIGSALTQFILIWWITDTTGQANALAVAGIMALLPQALFGPLGGTLADRWSRRLIMIGTDSITALCIIILIILFATDSVQLWQVYIIMFVRSTMQAFQHPAAIATTSMLIPPTWLSRVSAMNQTVSGLVYVAAAPLGAALLAFLPLQAALSIDVFTALLAVVPLLFFRIPQYIRTDTSQKSTWQDFRDGLRFVAGKRGILYLFGITVFMLSVQIPSFTLIPLLVRNEFGGGIEQVALMDGLAGLGMLIGGIIASIFAVRRKQMRQVLLGYAVASLTITGVGVIDRHLFWAAVLTWFIGSGIYAFGNAPVIGILQRIIPNEVQGRTFSLLSTLNGFAAPVGLAVAAPLAEILGVRAILVIGGVLGALICLTGLLSPALMNLED